ncbi:MAG: DUF4199 domain-containing protein [Bacteroidota bacterium]
MDFQDSINEVKPELEWRQAINIGLISGGINVVIMLAKFLAGYEVYFNMWTLLQIPLVWGLIVCLNMNIRKQRPDPYMTWQHAFFLLMISFITCDILVQFFNYILNNFIDPDLPRVTYEFARNKTESMMIQFGAPQEKIDIALEEMEKKRGDFNITPLSVLIQIGKSTLFYAAISALLALIVRKNRPVFS